MRDKRQLWTPDIYADLPLPRQTKSIRVLDLQKSQFGLRDEPLVGTLRVISLGPDRPPFNALSYVWGAPSNPVDTLDCGSQQIEITRNCRDALRRLWEVHGAITIWVDAICINQTDNLEKEYQIPIMRDVYTWAKTVYIWLGESTFESMKIMDCLSHAAGVNYLPMNSDSLSKDPQSLYERVRFALMCLPPYTTIRFLGIKWRRFRSLWSPGLHYSHLATFLELPRFSRVWTFQEAVLACDAVVLCGSKSLRWDQVIRGFELLSHNLPEEHQDVASSGGRDTIVYYGNINLIPEIEGSIQSTLIPMFQRFQQLLNLWMMVQRPSGKLCTEGNLDTRPPTQSFADYQKPLIKIHSQLLWQRTLPQRACSVIMAYSPFLLISWAVSIYYFVRGTWGRYVPAVIIILMAAPFFWFLIMKSTIPSAGIFESHRENDAQKTTDALTEAILLCLKQRSAWDAKDRCFGLYGILQTLDLPLSKPDYTKSCGQIYDETFCALLKWQPSSILLLLDARKRRPDTDDMASTPSWVPNFHAINPDLTILANYFLYEPRRRLNATKNFPPPDPSPLPPPPSKPSTSAAYSTTLSPSAPLSPPKSHPNPPSNLSPPPTVQYPTSQPGSKIFLVAEILQHP